MVSDPQVYTIMLIALLASVLAVRLGATLYQ
uniref:Photosystem I reaction center subunit XII n=1 Tax=Guinardia striata TaxID=1514137 RepID=A0A2U9NNW5_9STRA|nr:photosystem I protein M [Guinardia striata]AWT38823.1 photosystem I protein M [Guinardia striata]